MTGDNNSSSNGTTLKPPVTTISTTRYGGCVYSHLTSTDIFADFAIVMGIILLCENLLLIIVIARTLALHTNTNILVASLAITDVLVGVQACIMGLSLQPTGLRSWLGLSPESTRAFDSFLTGLNNSLVVVSMCHIGALALDRYLFVLWPLHYHIRVTRCRALASASFFWTLGLTYMVIPILIFRDPKYHTKCIIWEPPEEYGFGPYISVYFLCLCIVFSSTIGLAKIALKHKRKRQQKLLERDKQLNGKHNFQGNQPRTDAAAGNNSVQLLSNMCGHDEMTPNGNEGSLKNNPSVTREHSNCEIALNENVPNINRDMCLNTPVDQNIANCDLAESTSVIVIHNENDKSNTVTQNEDLNFEFQPRPEENRTEPESSLALYIVSESCLDRQNVTPATTPDIMTRHFSTRPSTEASEPHTQTLTFLSRANCDNNKGSRESESSNLFSQENVRIIKFVIVICSCFLLCTIVPFVVFIYNNFVNSSLLPESMTPAMYLILASNSGMNFIIITYMNKDFRAALVKTLTRCTVGCKNSKRTKLLYTWRF